MMAPALVRSSASGLPFNPISVRDEDPAFPLFVIGGNKFAGGQAAKHAVAPMPEERPTCKPPLEQPFRQCPATYLIALWLVQDA
jgi:hypothetical protein